VRIGQLLIAQVGSGFHEAVVIERHAALQPACVRLRPRHQEYVPEIGHFEFPIAGRPRDTLQSIRAVERRELRARMQADVRCFFRCGE